MTRCICDFAEACDGSCQRLVERFFAKTIRSASGCLEWTGARGTRGYGRVNVRSTNRRANRVAWEIANGPIPEGMHVLHRCDNRQCVDADHLFLGTNADNVADRVAKGRQHNSRGERNSRAILTLEEVASIRARHARKESTVTALARDHGVSISAIKHIVYNRNWTGA